MATQTTAKLKVLLAGQDPSLPGGMAKYVGGLSTYLATVRDVEAHFFNETQIKGRSGMTSANLWSAGCEFGTSLLAFRQSLKRLRPAVAHLHMAHGLSVMEKSVMASLAAGLGIPAVVHLHGAGLESTLADMPEWRRRWLNRSLAAPNHVIALSEGMKGLLKRYLPGVPSTVIPNAVMLISAPPPLRSPVTFGFIGFMDGRKGETELIEALAHSSASSSILLLAGNGPGQTAAREKALGCGVAERVYFLGNIDGVQKDEFFRQIDVLCLPSHAENLPIALLEAMGYGRPVITTPVGAIPELVTDGQQGWLIPVGDIAALSNALTESASSPEEVARRGKACWTTIAENFTWERNGPQVVELYRRVQAGKGRADKASKSS